MLLLLIIFSILIALISIGLTIGGLVKKRRTLWITSLAAFVVFTLLTVFSISMYIKNALDYLSSEKFQEDTREKAESLGKSWGNTVTGTAQGLEATLDDKVIAKLANKSGVIVGSGIKALAAGLDETTGKTTVFASKSTNEAGISIGRAERITDSLKHSYGLFLEFKKDFNGKLLLTAYDNKGLKMENSELKINENAGKEKVFVFQFDYFKPGLSGYCILTKSK